MKAVSFFDMNLISNYVTATANYLSHQFPTPLAKVGVAFLAASVGFDAWCLRKDIQLQEYVWARWDAEGAGPDKAFREAEEHHYKNVIPQPPSAAATDDCKASIADLRDKGGALRHDLWSAVCACGNEKSCDFKWLFARCAFVLCVASEAPSKPYALVIGSVVTLFSLGLDACRMTSYAKAAKSIKEIASYTIVPIIASVLVIKTLDDW